MDKNGLMTIIVVGILMAIVCFGVGVGNGYSICAGWCTGGLGCIIGTIIIWVCYEVIFNNRKF